MLNTIITSFLRYGKTTFVHEYIKQLLNNDEKLAIHLKEYVIFNVGNDQKGVKIKAVKYFD
ncbi:hypothetical protein N9R04_03490 [Staphylococcus sp. SQ8-PEA]|uniref:CobW/HypB/UreG nucleotide-binding domain-containing protein n=1 Tax=Staphylococcus marylandisciuri TaxID=2981529 RepID=A0ABT2QP83_9STAP|nr:hypothetical protein [Staphylococcus marylandisciuri]MCU5745785.1 hypothetical protein [Staphylococcus marylandisciuri]